MEEVVDRIKEIISDLHITPTEFSRRVDILQTNISRKLRGISPITDRDLYKISENTGYSLSWLRTGEGDKKASIMQSGEGDKKPFYDINFELGLDYMYNDTPNIPTSYIQVPGYEKAEFWCRASGESMKPVINNGDIIALREINRWTDFIPMNEVYAITTTNGLRTVKIIKSGDQEDSLRLCAYNKEYEDQQIKKETITKVYKVVGVLKAL